MGKNEITLTKQEENIANVMEKLEYNGNKVAPTIDNFVNIIKYDTYLNKKYQYDLFSYQRQYIEYDEEDNVKNIRRWDDDDDSEFRLYIEKYYHIFNRQKYKDGLAIAIKSKSYHPLKDLIEYGKWDGTPRIDNFFKDILKCDANNDYLREVSRMLFYGGIARIYEPGVKFDYMFVMTGKQGIGKSTIVQWLALHNNYYREVKEIDDNNKSIENILGGWMCEFAELMAWRNNASSEKLKAFITRQVDSGRLAYRENPGFYPRQCIFLGTTNEPDFLSDVTGNRRFLPIHVGLDVGELFDNEEYIKEYISQCWKEALYLYKEKKIYLTIPKEYFAIVEEERESVVVEDIKLLALQEYLDEKEIGYRVCRKEIIANVFNKVQRDMTKGDTQMVTKYMALQTNWEYRKNPTYLEDYGSQRYWTKLEPSKRELEKESEDDLNDTN